MQVGSEEDLQIRHHPHRYLITHPLLRSDPAVMQVDESDIPLPSQEPDDPGWNPLSGRRVTVYSSILFIICLVYFIRCVTAIAADMGL